MPVMTSAVDRVEATSPWGVLPIAVAIVIAIAVRAGAVVFHDRPLRERALGGSLLAIGFVVVTTRVLGAFGQLTSSALLAASIAFGTYLFVVFRERKLLRKTDGTPTRSRGSERFFTRDSVPLVGVGAAAIGICVAAAYLLPVWHWDALGYHLPYVAFALQSGSLAGVPHDIPYISTYPHAVELVFVAWRAMLPDDRLVDAAQIPFGIVGALATAAIARKLGARRDHAVGAGALWLTLPAVFLQLPTNYVDVASAALFLGAAYFALPPAPFGQTRQGDDAVESTFAGWRDALVTGLAIALYLGSKPSAPVGTVILFGLLALRLWRGRARRPVDGAPVPRLAKLHAFCKTTVAALVVAAIGAEAYFVNVVRHHNPIWPVEVNAGPVHLPGLKPMSYLLESGAAAPHMRAIWGPLRVLQSWATLDAPPVFDMRYGGFGLVFLVAIPFALVTVARAVLLAPHERAALDGASERALLRVVQRVRSAPIRGGALAVVAVVLAAIASPDPAVPRYVLALPALAFALAAAGLTASPHPSADARAPRATLSGLRARTRLLAPLVGRVRPFALGAVAACAAAAVIHAYPGLSGEGPPLRAYLSMSNTERARAVGADGPPIAFFDAHARVLPSETVAFDDSIDLPYLAWPPDHSHRAVFISDAGDDAAIDGLIHDSRVRLLVVGDLTKAAYRVQSSFRAAFHCKSGPCTVYFRR